MAKKTDKIEVRVAPGTKKAFQDTCDQQGKSASDVIRDFIDDYIKRFHVPFAGQRFATGARAISRSPLWMKAAVSALAIGGLAVVAVPSQAEPFSSRAESMFLGHLDQDGDAHLSVDELRLMGMTEDRYRVVVAEAADFMQTRAQEQFAAMDSNLDGRISLREYLVHQAERDRELFALIDRDGNGWIKLPEFLDPPPAGRAALSGSASGTAFRQGWQADQVGDSMHGVEWVMGFRDDMPPEIRPFMGQVFRDYDENGDDSISVDEFLKR